MRRFRRKPEESAESYERRAPLFVLLGSFLLYFLRFGYDYGNSDQDEVIPYLLHRLDPGLFTQDWFVSIQVSEFSVRTYFVWLLNSFSLLFPIWLTVVMIYAACWLFLAAAVYKLAYHFTRDQLAACAAIVLGLVLTPVWTLGGNDLAHSMLVASMISWTLGLWAIYHFVRSRYLVSPVLLGIACWIQPLVGLHLAMLLFLIRVFKYVRDHERVQTLGGIVAWGLFFVLWASPALGPIVYQQLVAIPSDFNPDPSIYYILAEFRLPHHYLPGSFYFHNVIRFTLLGVGAGASLLWIPFRTQLQDLSFLLRMLGLIAGFCLIGWVFTELIPILLVAKLQLFKMTVLAKLIFVILLCGVISHALPDGLRRSLRSILRRPVWGLAILTLIWIGVIAATVAGDGFLHQRVEPFRRAESPLGHVQEWAHRQTHINTIFAVPPGLSTFRSEAHRTIVINFKAIPYEDEQMVTWFERLIDMAPIDLPRRGGPELVEQLDAAYESLGARQLVALSDRYDFTHVLRRTPLTAASSRFEEVFTTDGWYVYRLMDPAETVPEDPTNPGEDSPPVAMRMPRTQPIATR